MLTTVKKILTTAILAIFITLPLATHAAEPSGTAPANLSTAEPQ